MEIITPKPTKPPRMIVYSRHKMGKSTFGAQCPNPIFIDIEDGLENIDGDVKSLGVCKSFDDFCEQMKFLLTTDHGFKTLVVDSLDWLEHLIWAHICKENKWEQIGQGPFGAGYKLALSTWDRVIRGLDKLNREKKMMIVLLAHSKIIKFEDPTSANFDRITLDLHEKSSELLCEYVDIIGYACDRFAVTESTEGFGGKVVKARSTGQRVLRCTTSASYESGNRYGLPDNLELSFSALNEELKKHYAKRKTNDNRPSSNNTKDTGKHDGGDRVSESPHPKQITGGNNFDGRNLSDAKEAKEKIKKLKEEANAKFKELGSNLITGE